MRIQQRDSVKLGAPQSLRKSRGGSERLLQIVLDHRHMRRRSHQTRRSRREPKRRPQRRQAHNAANVEHARQPSTCELGQADLISEAASSRRTSEEKANRL